MTRIWCESAFIDGRPEAGVLIDIADGRFASITVGAEPGDATSPGGLHAARTGQRTQPRLPPGAAFAHPGRSRHLLDVARPHVPGGRAPAARHLPPPGPGRVRRDGTCRRRRASASSTTSITSPMARPTPTPTRWARRCSSQPPTPASASRCSTPSTSTVVCDADGYAAAVGAQRRFSDRTVDAWTDRIDQLVVGDTQLRRGRDPLGARRRPTLDAVCRRMGSVQAGTATCPRLRAGRRERGMPRPPREITGPVARRHRRALGALLRRPRHAPH